MPRTKYVEFRYRILDECFSDFKREYTLGNLLDKVNEKLEYVYGDKSISERQLKDDIKGIRSLLPEDVYLDANESQNLEGRQRYYRYTKEGFSIYKNELSEKEIANLRSTLQMLGRFRDVQTNAWLEEIISNLEVKFDIKSNAKKIISFQENIRYKGIEYLSSLIDATSNKKVLRIEYKGNKKNAEEMVKVFHPHYLKQYNNRWYLFGFDDNEHRVSNYPLDRIISVSVEDEKTYVENKEIDFDEYFRNIVGVTNKEDDKVEEVILKYSDFRFKYVVTKPIHHSQKILKEEENIVSLNVKINNELVSQILSFGSDVTVISPDSLKNEIVRKTKTLLGRYFPEQRDDINNIGPKENNRN